VLTCDVKKRYLKKIGKGVRDLQKVKNHWTIEHRLSPVGRCINISHGQYYEKRYRNLKIHKNTKVENFNKSM